MISALTFFVTSVTGRSFGEIPSASCHVSDRITEHDWIRLELTGPGPQTMHCVATLHRGPARWRICAGAQRWDVQNRSAVFKWLYG